MNILTKHNDGLHKVSERCGKAGMKRARVAVSLGMLAAFSVLAAEATQSKPNILLIMIDDLNRSPECFGGPAITPNIDRLAASGIRFDNAYSACPSCNPSRVAMMIGMRPENSGIYNNTQAFRESEKVGAHTTLPQYLQQNGYNTIAAGKIFHHAGNKRGKADPWSDPVSWTYLPEIDGGKTFGLDFKNRFHEPDGMPKWLARTAGTAAPSDRKHLKSTWVWGPLEKEVEPTNTSDWNNAEWGAAWLNKDDTDPQVANAPSPDDKPWLLGIGIFRPHIPLICPQEFFDLYETDENKHRLALPDLPENDLDDLSKAAGKPDWFARLVKAYPEEWKYVRHSYLACTTYADGAVGIILDGLARSAYADNTIVILMGDHGYQLGEKERHGKAWVWRQASSMPMIIRMPGGETGTIESAVSMLDLYPTVIELIGGSAPHELDGTSLVPQLKGVQAAREEPAIITNTGGQQIGVVLGQWHYISYKDGSEELYNHADDPREFTNLLHPSNFREKYRTVADRLQKHVPENRK